MNSHLKKKALVEQSKLKDFRNFLFLIWKHLRLPPPTALQYNIAEYLQSKDRRLIVEAFRGCGKSWITSAYVCHQLYLNPQIGTVIIDDGVHIGSCCTIDRGKIDSTYIGKNSMIDNMVHIGHNTFIGNNACIAAQTGISGSVTIGNNVTIGGKVGFAGHIKIGDNVVIAARSGVTKDIKENSTVAGFPAIDIKEWKKNLIRQKRYGYK